MKKLIVTMTILILFSAGSYCQPCSPDTSFQKPGIYPAGGKVETVYVGEEYYQAVTYFCQPDTLITIPIFPFPTATARVDSVIINNWNDTTKNLNLPPGLHMKCSTEDCMFYGNTKNCLDIFGKVKELADTGTYQVYLRVTSYVTIMTGAFKGVSSSKDLVYTPLKMYVKQKATRVNDVVLDEAKPVNIFVLPTGKDICIRLQRETNNGIAEVFNLMGQKIFSEAIYGKSKEINCKISKGIYFVKVNIDNNITAKKIVIQ